MFARRFRGLPGFVWAILLTVVLAFGVAVHDRVEDKVRGDFAKFSLSASRVLFEGGDPYNKAEVRRNYKYFPLNAVILGPFTGLSLPAAQGIWFAINSALLVFALLCHADFLRGWRVPRWVWIVALALAARFFWQNIKMGQWNTSVYSLAVIGFWLAARRPFLGGIVVALAAALKYLPFLLIFYFGLRREWKALAGILLGVVFWLLAVPTLILGPERHGELLAGFEAKARESYSEMRGEDNVVVGYSLRTTLFRYLTPALHEEQIIRDPIALVNLDPVTAGYLADALAVACVIPVLVMTWRAGPMHGRRGGREDLALLGLWFCVFLLVSPEVRKAHLLSTFTPALIVTACLASASTKRERKRLLIPIVVAAVGILVSSTTIDAMEPISEVATRYGSWTVVLVALFAATLASSCRYAQGSTSASSAGTGRGMADAGIMDPQAS